MRGTSIPKSLGHRLEGSFNFEASGGISLRVYSNSEPRNLEISDLQKGLIMVKDGRELVEEGSGFGVPVVRYRDKTFFSSAATVMLHQFDGVHQTIEKHYVMDTVSKKRIGRGSILSDAVYHRLHRAFSLGYLSVKTLRPFFDKVMELRRGVGIETQFFKVKPRGVVRVVYRCKADSIEVYVDLFELDLTDCEELVILNEQGASTFTRYSDASGRELIDRSIGAWDRVEAVRHFFLTREMGFHSA